MAAPRYSIIGLDLDDTITDHTGLFRKLTEEYGITENTTPADLTTRAFKRHLSPDQYEELANRAYGEMSLESPPMPEAVETIRALLESGAAVYIISHRLPERSQYAQNWIARHLPFFPQERAYFIDPQEGKGVLCTELGIEIFLDNKPGVLKEIPSSVERLLFDPHGAFAKSPPYPRITHWREFQQKMSS